MNFNEQSREYNKYSFGKYLTKRREKLGISLRELAKKVGIPAVYLHDIETGNYAAPFKTRDSNEDYMASFIKHLQISEEEIDSFYEMANASKPLGSKPISKGCAIINPNAVR